MTRLAFEIVYSLEDLKTQADRCNYTYFDPRNVRALQTKSIEFLPTLKLIEGRKPICIGIYVESAKMWGTTKLHYSVKIVWQKHTEKGWTMWFETTEPLHTSKDKAIAAAQAMLIGVTNT